MVTVSGTHPRIVVGIPAYNEERTIAKVVLQAQEYADIVAVCDDGSSDLTAAIAEKLGADVLRHEKNLGYGAALQSLFKIARELGAEVLVTLDGDGQHNPCEIPALVQPIRNNEADVVIGSRFLRGAKANAEVPRLRRLGIDAITRLANAASKNDLKDAQSGFRAYSKRALEKLQLTSDGMGISVEILMEANRNGLSVAEVPMECCYKGLDRTSTQNPLRHGTSVIVSIAHLAVEQRPLLSLGIPGVTLLALGIAFGVWMLQIYAVAHHIVTNIALASIAFVTVGFFCISTAITLYAISRLAEKMRNV